MEETKNETKEITVKKEMTQFEIEISNKLRECAIYAKSGILPNSFNTPEKVFTGMKYAREIGLTGEISALRNIAVINGTPSIWGDLPLALCLKSGQLEKISESFDEKTNTAICKLKRKGFDEITRTFSYAQAKFAGLMGEKNNVWKTFPQRMAQMKARSHALKDIFADILLGVVIAEYEFNTMPSENKIEEKVTADDLTSKILATNTVVQDEPVKSENVKNETDDYTDFFPFADLPKKNEVTND